MMACAYSLVMTPRFRPTMPVSDSIICFSERRGFSAVVAAVRAQPTSLSIKKYPANALNFDLDNFPLWFPDF